jgi:hypothetical protein
MADERMRDFIDHVEMWESGRHMANGAHTVKELNDFVEVMNVRTRQIMSDVGRQRGPEFWSAVEELAANAARICDQRKVFVDKQDKSALGM